MLSDQSILNLRSKSGVQSLRKQFSDVNSPAVAPLVALYRDSVPRRHNHPSRAPAAAQPAPVEPRVVVCDVGARAACSDL
eukprot:2816248-Rhodomonas_salina.2